MTARAAECRLRNLALMADRSRWNWYPYLPLRRAIAGHSPELGVLYDAWGVSGTPGWSATVIRANVLMLPATVEALLALPRETFDTLEELFGAGWRVD